ncbi:murein L,D-transpeptidase catalytic domain-containing protein [Hymenobacter sp. DG01]|uniref:murein L,D-transpeptidase catalytic domain-containing protein n=1 Tax=Hymenobacter sp. DG01 TaxID=2584940 RepID=UPI0035AE94FC
MYQAPGYPSVKSLARLVDHNPFYNQHHALLINMTLPSSAPRLRVVDLQKGKIVFETWVMHGEGSGNVRATHFSNRQGSNQTALGRYVVVGQYRGKFGRAYRLAGLDDTNSNALSRSIVLHSSRYISRGHVGRSKGCPAVSQAALKTMKPYLQIGTLVWLYR